eukprot:1466766-Ditylum_brightwellii.AAC.1
MDRIAADYDTGYTIRNASNKCSGESSADVEKPLSCRSSKLARLVPNKTVVLPDTTGQSNSQPPQTVLTKPHP